MSRMAKYTWQDRKFKITEINGYNVSGEWTDCHLIMKYEPCGKRSQGRHITRLLDC